MIKRTIYVPKWLDKQLVRASKGKSYSKLAATLLAMAFVKQGEKK